MKTEILTNNGCITLVRGNETRFFQFQDDIEGIAVALGWEKHETLSTAFDFIAGIDTPDEFQEACLSDYFSAKTTPQNTMYHDQSNYPVR